MFLNPKKQRTTHWLIIYMIGALLFITSNHLHIHPQQIALTSEHGAAVALSSIDDDIKAAQVGSEIKVSPDGVVKSASGMINVLAVFLLITLVAIALFRCCSRCLRSAKAGLPFLPFYGTPSLRAPPL